MRSAFVTLLVLGTACGGGSQSPLMPHPAQIGTFAYETSFEVRHEYATTRPRVERFELRGQVVVELDTMVVDARHGLCHPVLPPNPARFVFTCDEYTLSFDRRFPASNPQYAGNIAVTRVTQGPCLEYRTNPDRTQVCVRYDTIESLGFQRVTGSLRVRPLRTAAATDSTAQAP